MSDHIKAKSTRREFIRTAVAATGAATVASFVPTRFAIGQTAKVKLGLLLPYTGTYAALGVNLTDAMKLRLLEAGNKLGGREIEIVQVDSEADPAKAPANTNKLVTGEKVDFLIGPVHTGVAMAMVKVAREEGTITIINNAGANSVTRALCTPNVFRSSFASWQTSYPCGKVMWDDGHRNIVCISWKYGAGQEMIEGAAEGFTRLGGKVVKEIYVPFPDVEFQAQLTEIASLKPDAVFTFFSGGGAIKFMKDYAAAGLNKTVPLYGSGFLTDGTLAGAGAAGEGIKTTLHYADDLDTPINNRFRADFKKMTGRDADVFAVQGYDTGTLLVHAMQAVQGDTKARKDIIAALERVVVDSPRGTWTMSKAHNPVQDIYLRISKGGINRNLGVAMNALADPGTGCKMAAS